MPGLGCRQDRREKEVHGYSGVPANSQQNPTPSLTELKKSEILKCPSEEMIVKVYLKDYGDVGNYKRRRGKEKKKGGGRRRRKRRRKRQQK